MDRALSRMWSQRKVYDVQKVARQNKKVTHKNRSRNNGPTWSQVVLVAAAATSAADDTSQNGHFVFHFIFYCHFSKSFFVGLDAFNGVAMA